MPRIAHASVTELRRTADTLSYEHNRMSQKLTDFRHVALTLNIYLPWKSG